VFRIVAGTAIAEPDIQITIGAEGQVAAVVIGVRLRNHRITAGTIPTEVES